MKEALANETPADVMRRKCRAMVQRAKADRWEGPPFNPWFLAGLNRIKVEETDQDIGGEGTLFPRRDRLVIQYRAGRMIERQRFTICHELAHTCFPDYYRFVRHHEAEGITDAAYRRFENLCDIGAGELLMPFEDFSADLPAGRVCLPHVSALGSRYLASIDAALKRVMDLTLYPCAAAFLTDESFKEFKAVPGQMRIKYFWKSASLKAFFPPGTLLPNESCAHAAPLKAADVFPKSPEVWQIDGKAGSWYVEPLRLPAVPNNKDYPKVVTLLHRPQTTT